MLTNLSALDEELEIQREAEAEAEKENMKYDLDNSKDWGYERAADDSDTDMHADVNRELQHAKSTLASTRKKSKSLTSTKSLTLTEASSRTR